MTIGAKKTLRSSDQKAIGEDMTMIQSAAQTRLRISPVITDQFFRSNSNTGSAMATNNMGHEEGFGRLMASIKCGMVSQPLITYPADLSSIGACPATAAPLKYIFTIVDSA